MVVLIHALQLFIALLFAILPVYGILWLVRHGDRLVDRVFPNLKWERELGWLNIRAYRRANTMLRGVRHALHTALLFALIGIVYCSWQIGRIVPENFDLIDLLVPLDRLGICLAIWIYYFVMKLAPRLKAEREERELQRFREENLSEEQRDEAARLAEKNRIVDWESSRTGLKRNL